MSQIINREPTDSDLKRLQAISRDELLSVEEEVELVKQIRLGEGDVEAAKEKLMRANERFVRTIAQQYVSETHNLEELMAEGNLGLEHAIYKYDEVRGYKFITYAVWWIRQSVQQYIVAKANYIKDQALKKLINSQEKLCNVQAAFSGESENEKNTK